MDRTLETTAPVPSSGPTHRDRACLVDGCACKDPRIVSMRRARFFASLAEVRGETADRVIAPDADWTLPARIESISFRPTFAQAG